MAPVGTGAQEGARVDAAEFHDEDRDIIIAQQKNLALHPSFKMMPFGIDAALSHFRRAVNQRLEEEKAQVSEPVRRG